MRQIQEYLLTKSNAKEIHWFPENADDKDTFIAFLEFMGFEKTKESDLKTYWEFHIVSRKSDRPFYILGEYNEANYWSQYVVFGKGGRVSKDNPIYLCRTTKHLGEADRYMKNIEDDNPRNHEFFKSYKEFMKDVMNNLFTI